jgi:hypothetical protein
MKNNRIPTVLLVLIGACILAIAFCKCGGAA